MAGGGGEAGSPGTAGVGGGALAFTTRCLGCWPPPRDLPGMSRAHCMVLITRDSPRSQAATACLRSGLQLHFVARSWSLVPAVPFRNHMQGAMLWWVSMAVPDGDHVPAHRWVSSSPRLPRRQLGSPGRNLSWALGCARVCVLEVNVGGRGTVPLPSPWRCDIWSHISLPAPCLKQTKVTLTRPAVLRGREPTKPGLWGHLQLNTLLMAVGGDTCVPHVPS